ncbi:MAG: universal stress protein [Desulfobacter sp.]|nr:MAG: universal stress protein [Desulfobacter sp.]
MKIMVYSKNTPGDSAAMDLALSHAKAFDASIELVSAISDQSNTPEEVIEDVSKRLKTQAAETAENHNVKCESQLVLTSLPIGEALVQYAEKNKIDEIIMPFRKRSKLGKLFFGSDTQYIILEAPCRVITLKDS